MAPALLAIEQYRADPDMLASGVAAVFALGTPEEIEHLLRDRGIPLEGAVLLASAQNNIDHRRALAGVRINIDIASSLELRLATLLVGLDRAPENLFHVSHENSDVIGALNLHDDDMVSQYSVWAAWENCNFSINNIRIPLKDIESQPANIRSWLFRLVARDQDAAVEHREIISVGSTDRDVEAREGLAEGLKGLYFEGIEEITIDWIADEPEVDLRHGILEHMAKFSDRSPTYERCTIDAYREFGSGTLLRARLEAASEGTPLYAKLRKIDIEGEQLALFGSSIGGVVVNQNINGTNVSIGVVSGSGNGITGSAAISADGIPGDSVVKIVERLSELIKSGSLAGSDQSSAESFLSEVTTSPSKSTLSKLLGWAKGIGAGVENAAKVVHAASEIAAEIESLI